MDEAIIKLLSGIITIFIIWIPYQLYEYYKRYKFYKNYYNENKETKHKGKSKFRQLLDQQLEEAKKQQNK